VDQQSSPSVPENPRATSTGQAPCQPTGQAPGQSLGRSSEPLSGQVSGQAPGQSLGRSAEPLSGQVSGQAPGQSLVQSAEPLPAQVSGQVTPGCGNPSGTVVQSPKSPFRHLSILPNVFTSLNLFCGYLSIILTSQDEFLAAGWMVVLAVICDILDGRLARLTSVTSKFGAELDSLSDLVSFGVAPAFLVFRRYLADYPLVGLISTSAFVLCGALRLARFNITPPSGRDVFTGLPIPAGAGILCTLTIFELQFFNFLRIPDQFIPAIVLATSFLMVSKVEYPALKKSKKTTGQRHILVLCFLTFLVVFPPLCLFSFSWGYAIYGPFMYVFRKTIGIFRRTKPEKTQPSI